MNRREKLMQKQSDAKVAKLLHPGQRCGNCLHLARYAPGRDSFFTGECGAITTPNGEPCRAPTIDNAGLGCLFWRASRRPGAAPREGE